MRMDVDVVECGPERREQALALLARLWSPDPQVNQAYWTWKYDRNPAAAGQRVYLALAGDRVVAMRGFIGAQWEAGEATLWAPCAGDTVVARDCEGRGLFRTLMRTAEAGLLADGHRFMFNLSAGPTVLLLSQRDGWRRVGSYDVWQRPGGGAAEAPEAADPFALLDRAAAAAGALARDGFTFGDRPRAADMAALVRRNPSPGTIRRVRDAAYFAWRFDNPLSRYRFLYRDGGELDGYLVLRVGRYRATNLVKIVDVEAASAGTLAALFDAAVGLAGASMMEIWAASLAPAVRAQLHAAGFAPRPEGGEDPRRRRTLLVKATDPSLDRDRWRLGSRSLLDPASWDLRMAWSDGV